MHYFNSDKCTEFHQDINDKIVELNNISQRENLNKPILKLTHHFFSHK